MIRSGNLLFLGLQKTGSTFVEDFMERELGGQKINYKHGRIPADYDYSGCTVVGGVRNPWDWYVSFWSYGCQKRGGFSDRALFEQMSLLKRIRISRRQNAPVSIQLQKFPEFLLHEMRRNYSRTRRAEWEALLSDAGNPENFRGWLTRLLDPEYRYDSMADYGASEAHRHMGIYSFFYYCLYLKTTHRLYQKDWRPIDESELYVSEFVRTESLTSDFARILQRCGDVSEDSISKLSTSRKINQSERDTDYRRYYDAGTMELVRERERDIITRHGYEF